MMDVFRFFRSTFKKFEKERHHDDGKQRSTWELTVEVSEDELDGGWVATCLELPGCMSQGETVQEAVENLTDAITGVLRVKLVEEFRTSTPTEKHNSTPLRYKIAV